MRLQPESEHTRDFTFRRPGLPIPGSRTRSPARPEEADLRCKGGDSSHESRLSAEQTQIEVASDYDVAARLAGEFFIRGVEIVARAHDGDLVRGIIFTAIAVANNESSPLANADGKLRPVSVMSIASSIGVPYETTRRYVNLLVSEGLCERMGRSGVVVTEAALVSPAMVGAFQETFTSFNRLVTALRRFKYAGS